MKEAVLIYPHQLFKDSTLLQKGRVVFLVEEPLYFTQYRFHKQKLILHRASMQAYKDMLIGLGFDVEYIEFWQMVETQDIGKILATKGVEKIYMYDVVDDWLSTRLMEGLQGTGVGCEVLDTPMFLTTMSELDSHFKPKLAQNKKLLMHTFYVWQRKRLNILIDENQEPVGGVWSHDEENRKKLPKDITLPDLYTHNDSQYVQEAIAYIEKYFSTNYGQYEIFIYPVTHAEAESWLDGFIESKLDPFGPYEDAISTEHPFVYHSLLSPLLNIGLLEPQDVIEKILKHHNETSVHIPSLEGMIRQIVGWREYVRAVYVYKGKKIRSSNYFDAHNTLPSTFWTGGVGLDPVDDVIRTTNKYAYAHHIQRLMVMGNIMNLCNVHPDEVYKWFMEMYIDAYDWVMVPNVYSMALYADGGIITTKPYISSSRYILSMSDYSKGSWAEIWDSLYWNFVGSRYHLLASENRLGFVGVMYKKMSDDTKKQHKKVAERFLKDIFGV